MLVRLSPPAKYEFFINTFCRCKRNPPFFLNLYAKYRLLLPCKHDGLLRLPSHGVLNDLNGKSNDFLLVQSIDYLDSAFHAIAWMVWLQLYSVENTVLSNLYKISK